MTRFTLALVVMALGFGCGPREIDPRPEPRLQDAWDRGLEDQYMLGSVFPISVVLGNEGATYEVESRDPSVLTLTESAAGGLEARALAVGETTLVLFENGDEINSFPVRVDTPSSIELTVDREDTRGFLTGGGGGEFAIEDSLSLYAGGTVDIHVRYSNARGRVYGGEVVSAESALPMNVPSWSPQANIFRVSAAEAGAYSIRFRVGELAAELDVRVVNAIADLELIEVIESETPYFLADGSGVLTGYEVVRPVARDDEGNVVHGTLPIRWSADLGEGIVELGEGTLLGAMATSDTEVAVEISVLATLDGLTASATVASPEIFIAE